jgi:Histidine kinase
MFFSKIIIPLLFCLAILQNVVGQKIVIDSIVIPQNSQYNREKSVIIPSKALIELNYQQNYFFVYFHSDKPNANYSYWTKNLDGNIKHYEIHTKNNYAYFSNLPSGEFIFNVKDGDNKGAETELTIQINAPFWFQWWFPPLLFLMILSVAGIILYTFFQYRLRQQLRLQSVRHELEIKALRAQMNPHFIFNCMNTIDAYILRKKFLEASDYLQKFSKLIRKILENSESQTISIEQEIQTLKLYIELEQERFSGSFSYVFDIEPELQENDYQIPSLVLQPFVENAILHGIRHLTERKGEIIVRLHKIEEKDKEPILHCQIQDNGIGRKASTIVNQQRQASHKSMGVNVTLERISTYQAIYGNRMETTISDLEVGTLVEIKLPLLIG